jgi:hypothetical protein
MDGVLSIVLAGWCGLVGCPGSRGRVTQPRQFSRSGSRCLPALPHTWSVTLACLDCSLAIYVHIALASRLKYQHQERETHRSKAATIGIL